MATLTSTRAADSFPVFKAGGDVVQAARGTYALAANPGVADIIQMCKLPAGAVVLGGRILAPDIDTNGTETLDLDLGWAANGGTGTYDAADPDGLGNFGVWNGDAFATGNTFVGAGNGFDLAGILATGINPYFTRETMIQLVCNAVAAMFAAGSISVVIYYVVDESLVAT